MVLLAVLNLALIVLFALDSPSPTAATVQVSLLSQSTVYETGVLSVGIPLVGNITLSLGSVQGTTPSSYQLYILNDAQYTAFTTGPYPRPSTPQSSYYYSGQNVDYFGKTGQIVFPVSVSINSTGNYYLLLFSGFQPLSANPGPGFFLSQASSQGYKFGVSPTVFEASLALVALILTVAVAYPED